MSAKTVSLSTPAAAVPQIPYGALFSHFPLSSSMTQYRDYGADTLLHYSPYLSHLLRYVIFPLSLTYLQHTFLDQSSQSVPFGATIHNNAMRDPSSSTIVEDSKKPRELLR